MAPDTLDRLRQPEPREPTYTDEEEALEARLERVRAEKRAALLDPGPSWGMWFRFHAAKWYVALGYLIVAAWEVGYLFPPTSAPVYVVLPAVVATFYADYVLFQYLWYRPTLGSAARSRGPPGRFHRWRRPFAYGRWTPEAAQIRSGEILVGPGGAPDPREFL